MTRRRISPDGEAPRMDGDGTEATDASLVTLTTSGRPDVKVVEQTRSEADLDAPLVTSDREDVTEPTTLEALGEAGQARGGADQAGAQARGQAVRRARPRERGADAVHGHGDERGRLVPGRRNEAPQSRGTVKTNGAGVPPADLLASGASSNAVLSSGRGRDQPTSEVVREASPRDGEASPDRLWSHCPWCGRSRPPGLRRHAKRCGKPCRQAASKAARRAKHTDEIDVVVADTLEPSSRRGDCVGPERSVVEDRGATR